MIKLLVLLLATLISTVFAEPPYPRNYAYSEASASGSGSASASASAARNGYSDNNEDPRARCYKPIDAGYCYQTEPVENLNLQRRYAYDSTNAKRCVGFLYADCGGNANNFQTYEECVQACE